MIKGKHDQQFLKKKKKSFDLIFFLPLPNSYQVNLLRFCFIRNHDMCPKRFYIATAYQSDMQFQAVFPFCTLAFTLKEEDTMSF